MRALSAATVFVAIAGYLVIWISSKALTPDSYVHFMVFWGLFFALTGLIDGLMQETTRGVTATREDTPHERIRSNRTAQPFAMAARFGIFFGLVSLASSPLWINQVSPGNEMWGAALTSAGLACFAFQAVVCGLLSSASQWRLFAWLIAIDSGVRLLLAIIAWALGWHIIAFLIITVIGAATWFGFAALSPTTRTMLAWRTDVPARVYVTNGIKAMLASGANAILITGFSVLLQFTAQADTASAALAGTITAVNLTRAPLLVPLQKFQPALIVHFTKNRDRILRAAALPMLAVAGTAAFGGVLAWLIGQPIMALLFDEAYLVSPEALGLLTLASGSTALLMTTGSAALAANRHNLYWIGWAVATAIAIGLLLADTTPETRSILALGAGPLVGVTVHLIALVRLPSVPLESTSSTPQ